MSVDLDVKGKRIAKISTNVKVDFNSKSQLGDKNFDKSKNYEVVKSLGDTNSRNSSRGKINPWNYLKNEKTNFYLCEKTRRTNNNVK